MAIELNKQLSFAHTRANLYHYRTTTGREVDFLLEGPEGKIVALEVKSTGKVSIKDFTHMMALQKELPQTFHRGFVIYQGRDTVPFGKNLFALPLASFWQS